MRKECEGCVYWRPLGPRDGLHACHYCYDTGHMKKISKRGKCLSRKKDKKSEVEENGCEDLQAV